MAESVFRYVLNRLSVLTDDQLKELDFDTALTIISESELNQYEKQKLKDLFSSIQEELPITHHGVLGMKWGIRRYQDKDGTLTSAGKQRLADTTAKQSIFGTASRFQVKTRNGDLITAEPLKPPSTGMKIIHALMGTSPNDKLGSRGDANYTLNNSKGEKIGELSLISKNATTTYWDWITIDDSQRGKGYATDIINDLFIKANEAGYSKVEINALKKPRPLYERLGFTYTDTSKMSIMDRINGFEVGAKHMEYDLTKLRHSVDGFYHHGILGMKWGVRRTEAQLSKTRGMPKKELQKSVKGMSDDELRKAVNRLQMEKQYLQLSSSDISKGKQYAQKIMRAGTTVAAVTTTGLTIYNNAGKIKDIISKMKA